MTNTDPKNVYQKLPLSTVDGIPVFSEHDRYTANYEQIASHHLEAMEGGSENPFMDAKLWVELEESTRSLLRKYVQANSRVLDVGVGLGRLLGPMSEYDRYGIDISPGYLEHAKAAGINVALSRIEDIPYKNELFDAAVCCDVLEHVLDLHDCTQRVLDVVKPGGILIIRVPFKEDLSGYLSPDSPYEFVHLRNFDVESLQLHFTRIFDCEWLEHTFVGAFFTNPTRLVLRVPDENNPIHDYLKDIPDSDHPMSELKSLCKFTEEELHVKLRNIQTEYPAEFEEIAPALLVPLEVNVVLRKPSSVG